MKLINKMLLYCGLIIMLCSSLEAEVMPDKSKHPFLIVKKEQFEALREKSGKEPWESMKFDAIARSNAESFIASESRDSRELQDYIGAAALAYILDVGNAQIHANRVRDVILQQYSQLILKDGSDWGGVVPPMGSFFMAILSLDIVYNALSEEDIEKCEHVISSQIFKISRSGSWADVRRGTHGAWDIYKGERTEPDDDYYNNIMAQITEDGVSPVTIHYAWERVGGGDSRISKSGYMDVLEYTGIDKRYYNNDKLQKFMRWLFCSSVNTSREMALIGDMLPTQNINNDMLHRRVGNFDEKAAAYAAWFHKGVKAKGSIISYIIPKQKFPDPQVPVSKIYNDGGAFFREKQDGPNGLHAVLYNIKGNDEWHTHNEVNGLALSGYGNRLMVNGGRLGEPTRAAYLNNTLTIGGKNHDLRTGGGIVEGFVGTELDYACGASGLAMGDDLHYRSLLLVHGTDQANAYCILFDEVETHQDEPVKVYLHPANESLVSTLSEHEEFTADIDHYPSVKGSKLGFFYATPPVKVNIEKSQSAVQDRYPGYPEHNRLEAVYETDINGKKNIITVLFPYNADHKKADFYRISIDGCTGAAIKQAGRVTDYAFESQDGLVKMYEGATFNGKAILYRKFNNKISFYFVKSGTKFTYEGTGFESDSPISLYIKNRKGMVNSLNGTTLTLFSDNISAVRVDNKKVAPIEKGKGYVTIALVKGNHSISF